MSNVSSRVSRFLSSGYLLSPQAALSIRLNTESCFPQTPVEFLEVVKPLVSPVPENNIDIFGARLDPAVSIFSGAKAVGPRCSLDSRLS